MSIVEEQLSHNMERDILVTGHRNPDTDSICAAIAYARLKNIINHTNRYIPCRAGNPNTETILRRRSRAYWKVSKRRFRMWRIERRREFLKICL